MVLCRCSKEAQISSIHTIVKRLDKRLSGDKGMISKVDRFEGALKLLAFFCVIGGAAGITALIKTLAN